MKRVIGLVLAVALLAVFGVACGEGGGGKIKVGMVTDAGTIDDKSFNQGTWEGVQMAKEEFGLDTKYLKPGAENPAEADYIKEIDNLYAAGYRMMVCPGFKFETAIWKVQTKYPDAKFVLIDGWPHNGDYVADFKTNTVGIVYAEEQAGFLAGVAAAMKVKTGSAGFIGGMPVPAVQRFNWGFQQGVAYANANLDTSLELVADNVIYADSFSDVNKGQQLAAAMFNKGVKVIFAAAGGVGVGAIQEAMARAKTGDMVWIVGVDVDQYADGIYEGEKSVILTSAMKAIKKTAYEMIKAQLEDKFPGGQLLKYDATNGGIQLPDVNPNLEKEITDKVAEITEKIKDGTIVVANTQGDLIP